MAEALLEFKKSKTGELIQDLLIKQPIVDAESKLTIYNNLVKNTSSAVESYVKSTSKFIDKSLKNEFEKTKLEFTKYENISYKAIKGSNDVLLNTLVNSTADLQMIIKHEVKKLNKNIESMLLTPFKEFQNEVEEVKKKKRDFEKANPKVEPILEKYEKAEYEVDTFQKQIKQAKDENDTELLDEAFMEYNSSLKKKDKYEAELNNARSPYYRYIEGLFKCVSEETNLANCFKDYLKLQTEYHLNMSKKFEKKIQEVDDAINNHSKKTIFDVNIEEFLRVSSSKIPNGVSEVIRKLIQSIINKNGLNEEGILSKPGDLPKVNELMKAINSGYLEYVNFNDYGVHDLGSVLKQYLRDLPDSILCNDLSIDWLDVLNYESKIERFKYLLKKLPNENFENFKYIVKFLNCIIENSERNNMNASKVSECFLDLIKLKSKKKSKKKMIHYKVIDFMGFLLANHNELIPGDIDFSQFKPSEPLNDSNASLRITNLPIIDSDSDNNSTACFKLTNNKVNSSKEHKTNKKNNKNYNNNNNHTEEIINHSVIDDDRRYNEHSIKKVDIIF